MTQAKRAAALRKRSSWFADLRIILLGTWGFVRQSLRVLLTRKGKHELEAGD